VCLALLSAQAPLPGPSPCLNGCSTKAVWGETAGINHESRLQTGTTGPARSYRVGVTSDGAENAPRLRVTYGEDSKESAPPLKRRAETHTASAQDNSTPVPWRWRSRGARIRESPRPRSCGPEHACARESLGKEESDVGSIEETFRRIPVGPRAHPVESGQQPEASLASCGVTHRAKRRQPVSEPAHAAPKLGLIVGAPAVRACGGRACLPVLAWEGGPAGVFRSRRGHLGVPQEPGRPVCPRRSFGCSGQPILHVPGPCGCRRAAKGANSSLAHGGRSSANPMSTGRRTGRRRKAS
jgi:hypothetical protein